MKKYMVLLIGGLSLFATIVQAQELRLTWQDNSNNEVGFKVERKLGVAGTFAEITQPTINVTTYTDTGLAFATSYCYRVRAFNAAGNSGYSNEACATTTANPLPTAPSGLTVTPLP